MKPMKTNMPKKSESKNMGRYIQFRLNEDVYIEIDEFSTRFGISKSELARKSIFKYILTFDNPEHPNPKLLFSQNMFKILIDNATLENIENLAKLSYENGMADSQYLNQGNIGSQSINSKFDTFYDRLASLADIIFPKEMQNWFEECHVLVENSNYLFEGVHALGANFSLFIKELLRLYSIDTKYELQNEYYGELIEKTKNKNQEMTEQRKYTVKFVFGLRN
ncbi:MAG: hypothetical protein ACTSYI_11180 [Promethearchaeota archaeon]